MFRGALVGFSLALLMLLPPILHFLTGPLGPLVGGFFGGSRSAASLQQAVGIGILMALFMAAPIAGLVAFGTLVTSLLPPAVGDALALVGVIIVVYTGAMGAIGAALGGLLARRQPSKVGTANPRNPED